MLEYFPVCLGVILFYIFISFAIYTTICEQKNKDRNMEDYLSFSALLLLSLIAIIVVAVMAAYSIDYAVEMYQLGELR